MRTYDFASLFRSTIGFDRLFSTRDFMTESRLRRLKSLNIWSGPQRTGSATLSN